jgi:ribosomal RNA-processing protein 7
MGKEPRPDTIAGFSILPVTYSGPIAATHYFYIRTHESGKNSKSKGKQRELPENRTLFVVNVPPDATEREFTLFFKACGIVERVVFNSEPIDNLRGEDAEEDEAEEEKDENMDEDEEDGGESSDEMDEDEDGVALPSKKKRKSSKSKLKNPKPLVTPLPALPTRTLRRAGQTAYIVFLDESSLKRALNLPSTTSSKRLVWPPPSSDPEPSGLAYYMAMYDAQHPPLSAIREHADTYMELFEFEKAQNQKESKYKKGEAVVDEDGFTLVTRGGAYGKTLGGGVGVATKKFELDAAAGRPTSEGKKKKKKEKEKFYTFQIREQKRKGRLLRTSLIGKDEKLKILHIEFMDLRRNFEEDKRKVAELRKTRRFKPY